MTRPLRIAYITPYRLPDADASVQQFVYTLAALARHDARIDVIVPGAQNGAARTPAADTLAAFYGLAADTFRTVTIVPAGGAPVNGSQPRAFVHGVRAAEYVRDRSYDLVYTRSWHALVPSLFRKLPAIFETYRTDLNHLRRYALWRRYCYRRPTLLGIVAHSDLARGSFIDAAVPADRVLRAYNGYAPEVMHPVLTREDARRRLDLPLDRPIVAYTGSVRPDKGIETLVEIAARVRDALWLLVGGDASSSYFAQLVERTHAGGLAHVKCVPRVSPAEVPSYLYAADCLVIPPTARPLLSHRTVLPLKTFAYLAAGRPVVAPDLPDVREVLIDNSNARLVPPDDPVSAAEAIRDILCDPSLAGRLARQASVDARQYTWDARARQIAPFFRRLLGRSACVLASLSTLLE